MRRDSLRTIGFVLVFIVIAVLVICFDDIKAMVNEASALSRTFFMSRI